jgi:radical SAM superfamily enzyme YgiQ (UPF0313 family)
LRGAIYPDFAIDPISAKLRFREVKLYNDNNLEIFPTFKTRMKMSFSRPDIIRPPSEARAYFLPLTCGCSNNSCSFCNFYGCKLQIRDIAEVKKEIDALEVFLRIGSRNPGFPYIVYAIADEWDGKRVFLQDGDALVYPYPKLKEALGYLNAKFPDIERISSYGTAQDILRLTVDELNELKKEKLGIIYMGLESGDEDTLKKIGKGVNPQQIIEAGRKVKESGILLSVTVILGIAGIENSRNHALKTAEALTQIDPDYAGALTVTLNPGTPLYDQYRKGEFKLISPFQSLSELKTIIENTSFSNCFFSSMHASNYLSVRGTLPQDKAKMLKQIDHVLASGDPDLLRPEFLRGL